jgi:hypothetical protein
MLVLLDPSPDFIAYSRIGFCLDGKIPGVIVGKPVAFYRIFPGHDYRQTIIKLDIPGFKSMVVREVMLDDSDPQAAQVGKETRRITDPGNGVNRLSLE